MRPFVLERLDHAWRGLRALARWSWPHLRTAAGVGTVAAAAIGRAIVVLGRHALRRRAVLAALGTRAAWWTALWLWVVAGRALLDLRRPLEPTLLASHVLLGLALCVLALLFSSGRRLRWASLALALGHGSLGLLAWITVVS